MANLNFKVDADKCIGCRKCINELGCPALSLSAKTELENNTFKSKSRFIFSDFFKLIVFEKSKDVLKKVLL